jgi:hypothetical protein
MKNSLRSKWLCLLTLLFFLLSGCDLLGWADQSSLPEGNIETQIASTLIALHVAETLAAPPGVPAATEAVVPNDPVPPAEITQPTITLSPTITASPTVTLTPTLEKPMVSVSRNTYCRTGPGEPYDSVGTLMEGEQAEVVGVSSDGQTWIIMNPDGEGKCSLWGYYASVVGPTEGLPVYTPPPTPTPDFDWGGSWSVSIVPVGGAGVYPVLSMSVTVSGKSFTGSIDNGGIIETLTGTISDDYLSVSGNWSYGPVNGTFKIFALGVDQFQGNVSFWTDDYEFCGARGGAGFPSPCYKN